MTRRDNPEWRAVQALYIDPGAGDDDERFTIRVLAAARMYEIDSGRHCGDLLEKLKGAGRADALAYLSGTAAT